MADGERKKLMWDIKKSLFCLTPRNLFELAKNVGPVPGEEQPKLEKEDQEGCFDYICEFI